MECRTLPSALAAVDHDNSLEADAAVVGGTIFFAADHGNSGSELWKSNGTAAGTVLVKDIRTGADGSNPHNFLKINATVYFTADDGANGYELWKTDGTSTGTVLVKNIKSNSGSSNPSNFTDVNGTLFFTASHSSYGIELWKSNGTSSGTVLVKNIKTNSGSSSPANLTNVNGTLFFTADDGISGTELWKSDGTSDGTVLLRDIKPGAGSSAIHDLTNVNGILFFTAEDRTHGAELWKSDGSADGTVLVFDIAAFGSSNPRELTNVNGALYFVDSISTLTRLWKSDGTAEGTTIVIGPPALPGQPEQAIFNPRNLTSFGGQLVFTAHDATGGVELWRTNGTLFGTTRIFDVHPGARSADPRHLTVINGVLYFVADSPDSVGELWKTNGAASGTSLVKQINFGVDSSNPRNLVNVNGTLFFNADDGSIGSELYRSDGSQAGTVLIKDINPGAGSSDIAAGTVFFAADDGVTGRELWKSDGTSSGTVLVRDIFSGEEPSNPDNLLVIDGTLYFSAENSSNGVELWKSDGTSSGTVLIRNIRSGSSSSNPSNFTNVNGTLYFTANNGSNGIELWRSDGTSAGTVMVSDINPGAPTSNPHDLVNVDGALYFAADDGLAGSELWKTDGSTTGTVLVYDIKTGAGSSNPHELTNVGGDLFFVADDGLNGVELWRSNGSSGFTILVRDSNSNFGASSNPRELTDVGGTLYFLMSPFGVTELWRTDGTAARSFSLVGPRLIGQTIVDAAAFDLQNLTNVNGTLFFTADDRDESLESTGLELWKSDGSFEGTQNVRDIHSGPEASNPQSLTNVNGLVFFSADDGIFGNELWKSDGTVEGTRDAGDINLTTLFDSPSHPDDLTNVNGTIFLTADDGVHGRELWKSNGTLGGAFLVKDILTGAAGALGGESIPPPTNPTNNPPQVNAGSDRNANRGTPIALAGSANDDGIPGPLTITWTKSSGPGNAVFANASALNSNVTFYAAGQYVLRLTASDGLAQAFDEMTVVVQDPVTTTTTASLQDGLNGYSGTTDTKLRSDQADNKFGSATVLEADGNPDFASLIRWDLASIPVTSQVQSASITINVVNTTTATFELYQLLRTWSESEATFNHATAGAAWSSSGANGTTGASPDRATTVLGQITAPLAGPVTINLSAAGVAVIQSWIANPSSNNGFVLLDFDNASTDDLDFNSSEISTVANRPLLKLTYTNAGAPLVAASSTRNDVSSRSPNTSALQSLVTEAINRWAVAAGPSRAEAVKALLSRVTVAVVDLPGATLGRTSGNFIEIDVNAAGAGWFVDRTPSSDREFRRGQGGAAADRFDLLSVVIHEFGHVLGQGHDVLGDSLSPGERILPAALSAIDDCFAAACDPAINKGLGV